MIHRQDVCRKSMSSLHKVSRWSLSMYNVNKLWIIAVAVGGSLGSGERRPWGYF